jgi:hypothetical protein
MSAYIPGPWHVQPAAHDGGGFFIKPIPGQIIAEVDPSPMGEANARLIANAPELADALRRAAVALDAYSGGECEELDGIMALLARIEGVTP